MNRRVNKLPLLVGSNPLPNHIVTVILEPLDTLFTRSQDWSRTR